MKIPSGSYKEWTALNACRFEISFISKNSVSSFTFFNPHGVNLTGVRNKDNIKCNFRKSYKDLTCPICMDSDKQDS